jgi:hypothetical protein
MDIKFNFKNFFENEEKDGLIKTLDKVPKKHRELIHNFEIKYKNGTTLDKENVGLKCGKKIQISSPWHYSKEFVTLHELGHVVYEKMSLKNKNKWKKLLKNTIKNQREKTNSKDSLKQSQEEIFCMAYASTYCKHAPNTYVNKDWQNFIKTI